MHRIIHFYENGKNHTALVNFCGAGHGFNFAGLIDCNFSPVAGMAYCRMLNVQRPGIGWKFWR